MACWWRVCYKGSNKLSDVQSAERLLECPTPSINFKAQMGICDWMRRKKRPGMGVSLGVMIDEYLGATLIGGIAKKEAWWWLWMKKKRRKGCSGLLRICFNRYYLYHIIICSCHSCTIRSSQSIVQSVLSRVTLLLHCLPPSLFYSLESTLCCIAIIVLVHYNLCYLNLLTPNSDWLPISSYISTLESNE